MPTSMIATISSEVATGRRMNGRDGLKLYPCVRPAPQPSAAGGGGGSQERFADSLPRERGRVGVGADAADRRALSPAVAPAMLPLALPGCLSGRRAGGLAGLG